MLINNASSSGGGLSAAIGASGLGSLASLAGVNVGGGQTYSDLAQYLVGTNTLLDSVVDKFDFIKRYKIKISPRASSRKALKKNLTASYDKDSGVFTIGFTDYDPVFAQQVVNYCVDYLGNWFKDLGLDKNVMQKANLEQNIQNTFNEIRRLEEESHRLEQSVSMAYGSGGGVSIMLETQRIALELSAQQEVYKQLKVQLEMINVSIASESPIFQVLEKAEVPDQKSKPSRGMLCIIVTFGAFFFSVFLAFVLNAVENIKKDPEAMAKLRAKKENVRIYRED
ncbi:lipopolysaccharide biosynthesis protein [Leadbettera azotonutricia]